MSNLEIVHRDVIAKLRAKYGDELVDSVDALSEEITMRVISGEEVIGVSDEQREVMLDFAQWLVEHPKSGCTKEFIRPERVLN